MDFRAVFASRADETWKCFVCKNYLSYFPISVCSNQRDICGRCDLPEGITSHRDSAFETVVQFLKFPCRYKSEGCTKMLQPEEVPRHEENCRRKTVKCVMDGPRGCEWEETLPELREHCVKEHSELLLQDGVFHMDLAISTGSQYLMKVDGKIFIFLADFNKESKILRCAVYSVEANVASYRCKLSIRRGNTTISLEFDSTKFAEAITEEVCLQFSGRGTSSEEFADAEIIIAKDKIDDEEKTIEEEIREMERRAKVADLLRCGNCGHFAGPSVFRHTHTMKVLCADCNSKKGNRVQDKILSEIASLYPTYSRPKKTLIDDLVTMLTWLDPYQYRNKRCLFIKGGCKWRGSLKEIEDHLCEKHSHLFVDVETLETKIFANTPWWYFDVVKFCGRLLLLDYAVNNNGRLLCTVKKISVCEQKFSYEVEVGDAMECDGLGGFVMSSECLPLLEREDTFFMATCCFSKKQVFGKSESANFKLRIFKTA